MKELIKIVSTKQGEVVSLKELHKFLEVKTNPVLWATRMFEYGFVEDLDYITIKSERSDNKQVVIKDFALTLDCAKEISMIQRTPKGREARLYFIACEKKLRQLNVPQTYSEALLLAANQAKKLEIQSKQLEIKDKEIEVEKDKRVVQQMLSEALWDREDRNDLIPKWGRR